MTPVPASRLHSNEAQHHPSLIANGAGGLQIATMFLKCILPVFSLPDLKSLPLHLGSGATGASLGQDPTSENNWCSNCQ